MCGRVALPLACRVQKCSGLDRDRGAAAEELKLRTGPLAARLRGPRPWFPQHGPRLRASGPSADHAWGQQPSVVSVYPAKHPSGDVM